MKVFISYSTHDIEFARSVSCALRNTGFEAFLAEESWSPGQDHDHLRKALVASHIVVLIWSSNAAMSQWVLQEIGGTWARNGILIPVRLDDTPLPDTLRQLKYIDARECRLTAVLRVQSAATAACEQLLHARNRANAKQRREIEQRRAEQTKSGLAWAVGGAALALLFGSKS